MELLETDSGKTICLGDGQKVVIVLRSPPRQGIRFWRPIGNDNAHVVTAGAPPAGAAIPGVTGATFTAVADGVAHLSSSRYPCPISGSPCFASDQWQVTLVIRGA